MNAEDPPDALPPSGRSPLMPLGAALRLIGLGFLLGAILAGIIMWLLRRPEQPPIVLHPPPTAAPTATPLPTATPAPVFVFVSGGVRNPGMYELPPGARVGDALAKAGGLVEEADPALVNQAELVFDGAQIHVPLPPAPGEADASPNPQQPAAGLSGEAASTAGASAGGLININTATAEELTALPGVGPSRAAAIIAERPYEAIEDLERVSGIGPSAVATLTPLVKVNE